MFKYWYSSAVKYNILFIIYTENVSKVKMLTIYTMEQHIFVYSNIGL